MPPDPDLPPPGDAAPASALIAATGIGLRYGDRPILDGVDFSVRPGEIVTVIGPNGAGKTTLLKVLLGLIEPDRGRVHRRAGLRLGYLPQRFAPDPILPLTVARLMTLTSRRPRPAVAAALAETGAGRLIDAAVRTLSGGELQRVLLARALLVDPDLLILDEPVQGVDFAGEAALYELIGTIRRRRGCGVVMVSHDLHVVMAATDRVVCLNRHVCCAGTVEAVGRHPEYVRLFGRRAAEAMAVYTHRHDHAHDASGRAVPLEAGEERAPEPVPHDRDGCRYS
jgi:zinc transport system ATP-binding protein